MMQTLQEAYRLRSKKRNKVEGIKSLKDPLDVYEKLDEIAKGGYEKLDKEDSGYFLKCFGLFDKGEDFMLRVRVPIGQLTTEQALRIGEVAKTYGEDYIDLTTRMQVELRYLKIENIATVVRQLREVGISTFQTGVDNPRNIVTDPLDGLAFDNIIEVKPIVDTLQSMIIENPEWISALPRKFNTGILGSLSNSCNIFGHDCCFILANKEGQFGFNVYLGGRVGIQAKDINIFVTTDEVKDFYLALLRLYKRFGYRDNRNKNRLHFLLQDVGIENFVSAIKEEAGMTFASAGQSIVQSENIALGSNKVLLKNRKYAYKIVVPSGIFSGSDMIEAAKTAETFGSGHIRLGYDQNIYIVDIPSESLYDFEATEFISKYKPYHNIYFNDMIACAGTKTCSFGVIPNKPDAIEMAHFLNSEVAIESGSVRMNWSACPKGCGVHGIADIGFEGCKAKDDEGNRVDGVHILMGGKITKEAKEAKKLHKSLPLKEARHHVKYILKAYAKYKQRGETFERFEERFFASHYTYQALAFYTKINYVLNEKLELNTFLELDLEPKTNKQENLEVFDFGLKLFKILTGEKRYTGLENFEIILQDDRKITRDEVHRLNPKVPKKLSELIYMMTDNNKKTRAQVFSELLIMIKEIN
jgi:ferredoxin-nitrite reductase